MEAEALQAVLDYDSDDMSPLDSDDEPAFIEQPVEPECNSEPDDDQASDETSESDEDDSLEKQPSATLTSRDGTEWATVPPAGTTFRRNNFISVRPGPTVNVKHMDIAVDIFKYLIDERVVGDIVNFTNIRINEQFCICIWIRPYLYHYPE